VVFCDCTLYCAFDFPVVCLLIAVSLAAYSTKNGQDLAYFSMIAYEPIASISAWSCSACSKFIVIDIKSFSNSTWDMQGYVGYSTTHSAIIVAFRGSSNTKNWIDDFDATQVTYGKCSGCVIHKGFYQGYNTVSASVKAQVTTLVAKYRGAPIYVTGHSLGGALSVVAALDIHETFNNVEKLYTFGQPRVGNAAFATYVTSKISDAFRVIHYADIVPHLAPTALNYRHHNYEVWYQEDMKSYKVCNAEDPACSDSITPNKLSSGDHDISNYIKITTVAGNIRRIFENVLDAAISLV